MSPEEVALTLLPVVLAELEKQLENASDRELAATILADRLKLRTSMQAMLDARRGGTE